MDSKTEIKYNNSYGGDITMVSIITATYNRMDLLPVLYNSLLNQSNKNFEWVIVDDGSTDETKKLIKKYILENRIDIIYKYQPNGGKHRASNVGIKLANKELVTFIDSDDSLTKDAVEFIIQQWETVKDDKEYVGISGSRKYFQGEIIGNLGHARLKEFVDATSFEYRYRFNVTGDKTEVFRRDIIQQYKFPEFQNEKFIPEALVYNRIANDGYKLRWFKKPICICEYREDGLTAQAGKLFSRSWNGYSLYLKEILKYKEVSFKFKFKLIINYLMMGIKYRKSVFTLFKV